VDPVVLEPVVRVGPVGHTFEEKRHQCATPSPGHLLEHTRAVQLHPAIRADLDTDLLSMRRHGMTPFTGTSLDALLRSLEVTDLVICGVSLNVGIPGAVFEAVGLGYRVGVPRDAVVGVPVSYGEQVLAHSIAPVASLTTVDEVVESWTTEDTSTPPTL